MNRGSAPRHGVAGVLLLLLAQPIGTIGAAEAGLLHIGTTGIYCLREPCPSRGVFVPNPGRAGAPDRSGLVYAGMYGRAPAPRFEASPEDKARLEEAWSSYGCLAVKGKIVAGGGRGAAGKGSVADDEGRLVRGKGTAWENAESLPTIRVDEILGSCGTR